MKRHAGFRFTVAGICCSLLFLSSSSDAQPINYGDFMGDAVWFRMVQEDSGTDPTPLYGAPTVFGNSLDFDPVSFNAFASGAGGIDLTDGTLAMKIEAKPGVGISDLLYNEAGDFTLLGFGSDNTLSSVRAAFFVNILEVDGVGITPVNLNFSMDMSPDGGIYRLAEQGGGPLQQGNWSGSLVVDIDGALADAGVPFDLGATLVSVTLDNTLTALSQDGTSAFIAKKDFGGTSITVVIPEPVSLLLMAVGLIGLVVVRRRR
ncbi:MAG: PEP-CTERM sorting domain-containing protein [Pirellulales bacterium]